MVGANSATIAASYFAGTAGGTFSKTGLIGAITGSSDSASQLNSCYYLDSTVTGDGAGVAIATACSYEQMKNPATFSGFNFMSGFDWEIDLTSNYPLPQLQKLETFNLASGEVINGAVETQGTGETQAAGETQGIKGLKAQILAGTTLDSEVTSMRYLATIDSLNYQEVGFIISNINPEPLNDATDCLLRSTRTVYTSIVADGETVTAESLGGSYIVALTLNNIPKTAFDQAIYIRSYVKNMDGSIAYGELKPFSVRQFF